MGEGTGLSWGSPGRELTCGLSCWRAKGSSGFQIEAQISSRQAGDPDSGAAGSDPDQFQDTLSRSLGVPSETRECGGTSPLWESGSVSITL